MSTTIVCECGTEVSSRGLPGHRRGAAHLAKLSGPTPLVEVFAPVVETSEVDLEADLRSPVEATNDTPQDRAKAVRGAFAARGWPNEEHPGTVRDFLVEWNIPII